MYRKRVSGVGRYQLIKIFISRFYNPEYYSKNASSPFLLDYEDNREIPDNILLDVLDFCMKTDVCKSLNMSLLDLMKLDLPTYTTIKEAVRKENEKRAKIIDDQQKDLDKRQQQLLGDMHGHKQPQSRGRSRR